MYHSKHITIQHTSHLVKDKQEEIITFTFKHPITNEIIKFNQIVSDESLYMLLNESQYPKALHEYKELRNKISKLINYVNNNNSIPVHCGVDIINILK